jgi:hypothetical protein
MKAKYTSRQIKRTSRGLVRCLAQCRDCGWMADRYVGAARAASAHVRQTGHTVNVEQVITYKVHVAGWGK